MTQLSIVFEKILDSIHKVFTNIFGWIIAVFTAYLSWLGNDSGSFLLAERMLGIESGFTVKIIAVRTETKTQIRTEVRPIEVNRLTKWQKAMISLGYVFIGICGAGIIVFIIRIMRCR